MYSRQVLNESRAAKLIREVADPIGSIEQADLEPLLDRIGDSRVVCIGEASHGTSEFYEMRARITRELIQKKGFNIIGVEADWPDAARIDRFVRHRAQPEGREKAFTRFPTWMWRNREVERFVEWLREWNKAVSDIDRRAGFFGLDLYSLGTSVSAVIHYLDSVDPEAAAAARARYGCFTPYQEQPAAYGRAALIDPSVQCRDEAVAIVREMLERRLDYAERDGERFWDAVHNARLVADAERYYRLMHLGSVESWNMRDRHMFETLDALMTWDGPNAKAVVWAHNSHLGDASATEMADVGEINLGYLCRKKFENAAFLIGFGTDHGTVAAASDWGEPMEIMNVRPALEGSYERLCHESGVAAFRLSLRNPRRDELTEELLEPRLERAIGVIYRPQTERRSHYFRAILPKQFDEYIWFDKTEAVHALPAEEMSGMPDTYPFGL